MDERGARGCWSWTVVVLLLGCSDFDAASFERGDSTESPSAPLALGASGERVEAVQARLRAIGYLPNADLQRQFPDWRPLIPTEPAPGRFDETTQQAVSLFQVQNWFESTGTVDEATNALLFAPRCGVPEGLAASDASQKFSLGVFGVVAPGSTRTWKVLKKGPGVEIADVESAADQAGFAWGNYSTVRFRKANAGETPDFNITFGDTQGATSTTSGLAFGTPKITLNFQTAWSVVTPPFQLHRDLVTELTHDFGHMIGIGHSTATPSIMTAVVPEFDRRLYVDDMVAVSARYDQWESFDPCVKDIDSKAIPNQPARSTWAIECGTGDRRVWQYSQGVWREDFGASSTRIAVDHWGRPWTVDADGAVHFKSSSESNSGTWTRVPGCAKDIGADRTIWIIGCTAATGGFRMERFGGSSFELDTSGGAGTRITVDTLGRPWVVNSQFNVFRRTTDSASSGSWTRLNSTSPAFALAIDIGINTSGYAWVVDGAETFIWDEQPGETPLQAGVSMFVNTHGVAPSTPLAGVAGLDDGSALVVAKNGSVWRTTR